MDRRDMMIGIAGMAAAAGSLAMRPRNFVDLMGDVVIEDALPDRFAGWAINPRVGLVLPPSEGTLADRLYAQTVGRGYDRTGDAASRTVMMLISHGAKQSDSLQLHRPEVCYPAYGFAITDRRLTQLPFTADRTIPTVELTAKLGPRTEDVLYWARIGEELPQTAGEQREDRLRAALAGFVGDGVLVRLSIIREGDEPQHAILRDFARTLLRSVPKPLRVGLVGSKLGA